MGVILFNHLLKHNKMNTKVEQFRVKNQLIITTPEGQYFQSYESVIVFQPNKGKTQLDEKYWDYSKTTTKYLNLFLGESTQEIKAKIEKGEYLLTNLNS